MKGCDWLVHFGFMNNYVLPNQTDFPEFPGSQYKNPSIY